MDGRDCNRGAGVGERSAEGEGVGRPPAAREPERSGSLARPRGFARGTPSAVSRLPPLLEKAAQLSGCLNRNTERFLQISPSRSVADTTLH